MSNMKGDKPYELEHACCWRCCFFIFKYGTMACKKHKGIANIEPNMFCNTFAISEEEADLRDKEKATP